MNVNEKPGDNMPVKKHFVSENVTEEIHILPTNQAEAKQRLINKTNSNFFFYLFMFKLHFYFNQIVQTIKARVCLIYQ